nr:methionine--tRNA ligase [Chitinophagales bacterium]
MPNPPTLFLFPAPRSYANGPAHLGHIAGAYLPADIYVRYLRLMGEDVLFVCGSDENGAAITIQAKREGKTPQEIVNKYHEVLKNGFANLGIEFDIYHRTSSALHHQTASDFFKILYEKGVFTEITSEQYYDEQFNQFLADRYIQGTCPKCGSDRAYGDQCENCGSALSPTDLINPISILSKQPPALKTTKHWYLRMDELQADIKNWLQNTQENEPWKNHVIGQCNAWFNEGLQPRAMTRDLDWGVPVPLPDAQGKVLYVWLDAPIGYISATKQWAIDKGNPELWREYWQNPDTKLIHFIGKDNIVFHCINFPMILKAHGNYVLPTNVPANQFLNLEGQKFSTSRNHAVWVHEYLADFPEHQDALRYVLAANMPENKDSDFSWRDFQARNNNELLAVFGNFVNRVSVLMQKNYAGSVPAVPAHILEATNIEFANVFDTLQAFPYEYDPAIHNF